MSNSNNISTLKIKFDSPPPKSAGEEGTIAIGRGYIYVFVNGKWIRAPLNKYTR